MTKKEEEEEEECGEGGLLLEWSAATMKFEF